MHLTELAAEGLHGTWRDVIRGPDGQERYRGPIKSNAIVLDCRRVLASFVAGKASLGIQGMQFGAGNPAWDGGAPPAATPAQTKLVDPFPLLVPAASLQIDFVDALGAVTATPTNRVQIVASLGPGTPPWPDGNHASASLREFGLVGQLGGAPVLLNYVIHPVINKDAASTLERTLWLVF